jgi:hypothetical protein
MYAVENMNRAIEAKVRRPPEPDAPILPKLTGDTSAGDQHRAQLFRIAQHVIARANMPVER